MQSVHITTNVLSMNSPHGKVYSIQHYIMKFVSYLRQVSGFLRVSSTNKTDCHNITEILLKVALNIITLIPLMHKIYKFNIEMLISLRKKVFNCLTLQSNQGHIFCPFSKTLPDCSTLILVKRSSSFLLFKHFPSILITLFILQLFFFCHNKWVK